MILIEGNVSSVVCYYTTLLKNGSLSVIKRLFFCWSEGSVIKKNLQLFSPLQVC